MTVPEAARNNAEWCEVMCRADGVDTAFAPTFWASPRRTPPLYPDAVTLRPDVDRTALLEAVDATEGCSIKDSFACLDLSAAGFRPIIDATWISRPANYPAAPPSDTWSLTGTGEALTEWGAAWDGGAIDLFRSVLLLSPTVRVLAGHRSGKVVAGALANRSGSDMGITNLFTVDGDLDAAWSGVLSCIPGWRAVGYAAGPALAAALRLGFTALGPLRVWLRSGSE